MIYYRCKCGKSESWSSMGVRPCFECKDCHSTMATSPEGHGRAIPHEFIQQMVNTDDGEKPLSVCKYCLRTKKQIEEQEK